MGLETRDRTLESGVGISKNISALEIRLRGSGVEYGVAPMTEFDTRLKQTMRILLAKDELQADSAGYGVAHQILGQGMGSLSWRQRFVYLEEVVPLLRKHRLATQPDWVL